MRGLTLDTGALIALERGRRRVAALLLRAREQGLTITVPTPVVAEWWRGQRGPAARMLDAFDVEPLSAELASRAGTTLAMVAKRSAASGARPGVVDAVVMSSAAQRGDAVLTADRDDLECLGSVYPAVRLHGV